MKVEIIIQDKVLIIQEISGGDISHKKKNITIWKNLKIGGIGSKVKLINKFIKNMVVYLILD